MSSPSEWVVVPPWRPSSSGETPDFKTMLMTPAMASEPYWAAAPSRSTSILSIAADGIAFRSTLCAPRPIVPLT